MLFKRSLLFPAVALGVAVAACEEAAPPAHGGPNGSPQNGAGGGSIPKLGPLDLVTSTPYRKLILEVDYVAAKGPQPPSIDGMLEELERLRGGGHLGKPDGIEVVLDEVLEPFGGETVHSFEALRAVQRERRTLAAGPGEAVVHVLYVDGRYEGDGQSTFVLGFAYGGSSIVMLKDNLDRSCKSHPLLALAAPSLAERLCQLTEATVFLHELGHLFGLVNNGLPMVEPHQDEEHGAHDSNEKCIMYWLNERSTMTDLIAKRLLSDSSAKVSPFDAQCLADLKAVQP